MSINVSLVNGDTKDSLYEELHSFKDDEIGGAYSMHGSYEMFPCWTEIRLSNCQRQLNFRSGSITYIFMWYYEAPTKPRAVWYQLSRRDIFVSCLC